MAETFFLPKSRVLVRTVAVLVAIAAVIVPSHGASNFFNIAVGVLRTVEDLPVSDGALIQLVVSTEDSDFSLPTISSFLGESDDDVIIASFLLDQDTSGVAGSFVAGISVNYGQLYDGKVIAGGMPFALRFWPEIQTLSAGNPGVVADPTYGEFRRDDLADFSMIPWILPGGGGGIFDLNAITQEFHPIGSTPSSALQARPVPEPSSAALVLSGIFAFGCGQRNRNRRATV